MTSESRGIVTDLGLALGRIPSGLYILGVRRGDEETGMLASWVMQASFDPPMVTVALGRDRWASELISLGGALVALSVLSEGDAPLIGRFSRAIKKGEPAFQGLALVADQPAPALADGLAYLVGRPMDFLAAGDHLIHTIRIDDAKVLRDTKPLVHLRKDGLRY